MEEEKGRGGHQGPLPLLPAVDEGSPRVRVYDSATIHYVERVYTMANTRQRTRLSCYVQVTYDGKPYIAVVKSLVLLEPHPDAPSPSSGAADALRFALCDIYKYSAPLLDADTGNLLRARHYDADPDRTFVHRDYAVHLRSIDTKLVVLKVPESGGSRLYAVTCGGRSGMGAEA